MSTSDAKAKIQLLLIDPQNDFCDLPSHYYNHYGEEYPESDYFQHLKHPVFGQLKPQLPVNGAYADMRRVAQWIRREADKIDAITITLDSHQQYDIAHPGFWKRGDNKAVAPFTAITAAQVRNGDFLPRDATVLNRVLNYLDTLESQGKHSLMVWPVHCEIGTWGHGIHAHVLAACRYWQQRRQRAVKHVFKGTNPWTEHYSAFQAEVPLANDPSTQLNTDLLHDLDQAEHLIIAGEASSHCVRFSVEDLLRHLPSQRPQRLILLTDAMSPVAGFEAAHQDFIENARSAGMQISTCDQVRFTMKPTQKESYAWLEQHCNKYGDDEQVLLDIVNTIADIGSEVAGNAVCKSTPYSDHFGEQVTDEYHYEWKIKERDDGFHFVIDQGDCDIIERPLTDEFWINFENLLEKEVPMPIKNKLKFFGDYYIEY